MLAASMSCLCPGFKLESRVVLHDPEFGPVHATDQLWLYLMMSGPAFVACSHQCIDATRICCTARYQGLSVRPVLKIVNALGVSHLGQVQVRCS